jgi:hypothetical protein
MRALVRPGRVITFDDLYQPLLSREALALAAELATPDDRLTLAAAFSNYDRFQADTRDLVRRFEPLVAPELRDRFCVAHADIDLASALARQRVVFFELPIALWPEVAPYLATLVLEDLQGLLAELEVKSSSPRPFVVVIDDPSRIPRVDFGTLLATAKKAGVGVTLVTQHLTAFDASERGGWGRGLHDVLQNTTTKILFRQQDRQEAELASRLGQLEPLVSKEGLYHLPKGAAFVIDAQGPPAQITLRGPHGTAKGKFVPPIPRLYAEGEREAMHRTPALSLARLIDDQKRKALAKQAVGARHGESEGAETGDDGEDARGALPSGAPTTQALQLAGPSPLDPQRLLAEASPPAKPAPTAEPRAKKKIFRPKKRMGRE